MTIRSDIAWSTRDQISVRGLDLPNEILGHMDVAEFSFLQLTGRRPTPEQARVYNAIIIALVEHGITPSAIVARMTYAGAPESLQGAIAAGISGLGSIFVGSTEGAARMLYEAVPPDAIEGADLGAIARDTVAAFRERRDIVPGLGHFLHKPIDPRTPRLFAIAAENGLDGPYVELMQAIGLEVARATGKPMPINATGAIGAICCELRLPWEIVRGVGVMARAIGLVGHLAEEREQPMATEIWHRAEADATAHVRPAADD
ncbi:MAG: citrate synthase [Solirubrobacteraceae bacterium]|nr:citrate synthase [Solirubrobacteraceae bacterium]